MKKDYQKPAMLVVKLQQQSMLMQNSVITEIDNNAGLIPGGGGSGPALAPELNIIFGGWSPLDGLPE
ncbi:MAG: hypothetical protein J5545_04425 [Bacteroidaceae bacterium]|nr:hypothetical protein [Bacteroidaceae bacterium]